MRQTWQSAKRHEDVFLFFSHNISFFYCIEEHKKDFMVMKKNLVVLKINFYVYKKS